ncbi:DUF1289 domain-containing protein [Pseudogemmobacter faecipullorum]|uniref:DUF1289 domain-containing protein n=1 Tax=Pseudogemmobacter faecipullorum TaxID=2755041 RepID=A0ABS8CM57_9RHOB|nr:DUF1289 domain-containing protein [Pseudogemmobacter faecipullorum]
MKDEIWSRAEIESPCVKICVIHPEAKLCIGCWRSLQEIAEWSALSPEARHELMHELPLRAAKLQKRRGGRAARQARPE